MINDRSSKECSPIKAQKLWVSMSKLCSRKGYRAHTVDSWAEDDLEIRLAVVADGISRAAILDLVRVGPALRQWTVPGEASLARALLGALAVGNRIDTNANIRITALHDRKVISSALLTSVLAIAKLEKSLNLPLLRSAPFRVTGKAHAEVLERRLDCVHFLGIDVGRLGALDHLEAGCDLVEGDLLSPGAVVPDVDVESVSCVALDEGVVDGCCCGRQGEQRGEEPVLSVHFDGSDCDDIAKRQLLIEEVVRRSIQYPCIWRVAISKGIKVWLCALSGDKDMADCGGIGTIGTKTYLDHGEIEQSSLKERGLDMQNSMDKGANVPSMLEASCSCGSWWEYCDVFSMNPVGEYSKM